MKNNIKIKPTTSVTLEELFETLNFYAEKENYSQFTRIRELSGKVEEDNGSKARKILKKFLKDGFFYVKV